MRLKAILCLITFLLLGLGCSGSSSGIPDLHVVTARDLAGPYTGVLEGITVPSLAELGDTSKHVVVDIDLLHPLTATDKGGLNLVLESAVIPKTRTLMLGVGSAAINLQFVEFEGLDAYPADHVNHFLQVKNIVFVNVNGEWILVAQIARVGYAADANLNGVYVYQYVSYPKTMAQQMSRSEAIQYVNSILKLAGGLR
jgi:hypothetical protein